MTWTEDRLRTAREGAYANGVGTHIPLLAGVIAIARPGCVFEIGCGHCSSPLIGEMCEATGRAYYAWDSDPAWTACAGDLGGITVEPERCAVAFIDCIGPERLRWTKAMRDVAEYIVIHDTDNQGGDLAELLEYFNTFTYQFTYKRMRPWTTVVSMTRSYP